MFNVDQHAMEMIKSHDEHLVEKIPEGVDAAYNTSQGK